MLHSVGCAQPSAKRFADGWDRADASVAVHAVIDADTGTTYQCLPWNYRGWHGGGSSNDTHIGVEMCESSYIRYYKQGEAGYAPGKFQILNKAKAQAHCRTAYNAAVELFAFLCRECGLNPSDICSHKEGYKMGIASGHSDPEHYWSGLGMSYTMNGFRKDVEEKIEDLSNPFVDVKRGDYFFKPVLWAYWNGITSGVDATHFGPNQTCTRAQVVTFLWAASGKPGSSAENKFVDVKPGSYFYKPVLWAVENGITAGVDATHFGPYASCTRSQAVTFLWSAAGKPAPKINYVPFADVKKDAFYCKAVLWAYENGITAGVSENSFGPGISLTRAQFVTFLKKFDEYKNK